MASIKRFYTRADLGLPAPRAVSTAITPANGGVAVHYAGAAQGVSSEADARRRWVSYHRYHTQTHGWVDIAYTAGFDNWGNVYAGRGYGVRTAGQGTNDGNQNYYAFCWIGGGNETPSPAAIEALAWLINDARTAGGAGLRVRPHSSFKSTSCPGNKLRAIVAPWDGRSIESKPNLYVVQSGDTLGAIARKFDTTVAELVKLNGIADPDVIRVGQELRVNAAVPAPQPAPQPAPAPKPAPTPTPVAPKAPYSKSQWDGRALRAKVSLRFYNGPRWTNPTGSMSAGSQFPRIDDLVQVGNGWQFKVRNSAGGVYYVTANAQYIDLVVPAAARNPYAGKRLRAKVDVRYYNTPRWTNATGVVLRGHGFPRVDARVAVGGGHQYKVYNSRGAGPFYVTANPRFVELV